MAPSGCRSRPSQGLGRTQSTSTTPGKERSSTICCPSTLIHRPVPVHLPPLNRARRSLWGETCPAGSRYVVSLLPSHLRPCRACELNIRLDRKVSPGDLFLMDAGCEMHGYVSDVTRTWPVSGRFSSAQRDLYGHVLEAHAECLRGAVEGAKLRDLHALSVSMLSRAIVDLGLARNMSVSAVSKGPYRRFYPHSLGHWLGLDTHDTPGCVGTHTRSSLPSANALHEAQPASSCQKELGSGRSVDQLIPRAGSRLTPRIPLSESLVPGVVLTIEPGLYVPADADDVPAGESREIKMKEKRESRPVAARPAARSPRHPWRSLLLPRGRFLHPC